MLRVLLKFSKGNNVTSVITFFLFSQCEKKKTKNICREGINTFLLSLAIFPKHITFVAVGET
jgi:hypothetical protein